MSREDYADGLLVLVAAKVGYKEMIDTDRVVVCLMIPPRLSRILIRLLLLFQYMLFFLELMLHVRSRSDIWMFFHPRTECLDKRELNCSICTVMELHI